jgi:uncharacterized protein
VIATTPAPATTTPVASTERMHVLDVVRGVAVFGILVVNIYAFSGYGFISEVQKRAIPGAGFDSLTDELIGFLAEGKFYCLFSFLFGVGFSVFIKRASAGSPGTDAHGAKVGPDAVRLFKRRLTGLLLIGLVHSSLIWFGDILATYAVIGFALIPFVRRDDRTVLRWGAIMLLLPIALYAVLMGLAGFAPPQTPPSPAEAGLPPILATAIDGIAHGNYFDLVRGNVIFTIANVFRRLLLMFFPRVLGMFLLGFYVGRRGVFADLDGHATLLRRVCAVGFAVGLPVSFFASALATDVPGPPDLRGLAETILQSIGSPALALAYAAGLCLLFRRAPWPMLALAAVGRMALTNYLAQSVAGVLIFYGIGLEMFGRLSLMAVVAGSAAFFVLQMIASRLWLSIALFGPAEWLWRTFTYGRRFPLFR